MPSEVRKSARAEARGSVHGNADCVNADDDADGLARGRNSVTHQRSGRAAFSVLELLVVMGMIALLAAMLLPSLAAARNQAKSVVCRSNLSQIIRADGFYAEDNDGVYCPAAADMLRNLDRWHGQRDKPNEPFDSTRGPLVPYLGPDAAIHQCPTFPADEIAEQSKGFERGCGGYGYNKAFVGQQVEQYASGEYRVVADQAGASVGHLTRPAETIMFTDSAFAGRRLIEYSFAEPRFHPQFPDFRADPSIHFRHADQTNIGWCDGHVDTHRRTFTWASGFYAADPDKLGIGWFGTADDNSLFDLK
ncbi:MAG: type II secretion system GspH family protein [Planctomycetes bacterium]|nr:type II secretion system GspH family protein [Planctomycetota bacterium]